MTRPFLALMRLKPRCPSLDGFERCFRRSFSLSSGLLYGLLKRRWGAEESRKLVELYQKGLSITQISEELGDRSMHSVKNRVAALRSGRLEPSSRMPWTAEEDAVLIAKRQARCPYKDIHLPGRSTMALQARWKFVLNPELMEPSRATKPGEKVTDAEVERIIHLRVNENKSLREIANELGVSHTHIINTWNKRCKYLVPGDVLQKLRPSNAWTSEDDDLLVALYNSGTKPRDMKPHFPGRTKGAMKERLYALQRLRVLSKRQTHASPALMKSLKKELEPYVGARLSKADSKRIREQFPVSRAALNATLYRMRTGTADPKRMPLDEVEAEREIASRRSSERAV